MRELVQSILGKFGYRLIRTDNIFQARYGLKFFFPLLKQLGFAPKRIIDVGANRGTWTRTAIKFFPEAEYTLVEPQDELKAYIADLLSEGYKIRWVNAGAGDRVGSLPFTIAHRDDSSTFALTADEARAAGLQQKNLEIKTLNEIVASSGGFVPEMVKIDAEGFDLRVLEGGSELAGKTEVFLVEAAICSPSENTVPEVVRKMSELGYRLIDITDLNRSPKHGVLWLCELAFLAHQSRLLNTINSYE